MANYVHYGMEVRIFFIEVGILVGFVRAAVDLVYKKFLLLQIIYYAE